MRLKRILIAGFILLAVLLVGPIGIIDKYEFYPNGYDFEYKSFNRNIEIQELDVFSNPHKTYTGTYDELITQLGGDKDGPGKFIRLKIDIYHIQEWYSDFAKVLLVFLALLVLSTVPPRHINSFLRSEWMKRELKEDFPTFYKWVIKPGYKRWYSIVLLGISIYFLASTWMSYPQSDLEELEQFLNVLQPLQD
ncbi:MULTISPECIES: hypothetical protein [Pontibacillus]|uniref:Uncharacterized protein n=1 Tax=Pontibacillus chungwhensis TaxID=265426 RepID=A0ABY8V0J7_9BACI|nr:MULTISPECIES: hypothetical protein [Pontibacillus]MCD5324397.1 hypothetical protein [Pontibacillus sp. HN14]WIF99307.1 hypothetical protein QNI29_06510 [Pontibacillus chungwhensis]